MGTFCPDYCPSTEIRLLVVGFDRFRRSDSQALHDPYAVVHLVPGVGIITLALDKAAARVSGEFYLNAFNVMCSASADDTYRGLPEQKVFDIAYWLRKEAKLAGGKALVAGRIGARWQPNGSGARELGSCWSISMHRPMLMTEWLPALPPMRSAACR